MHPRMPAAESHSTRARSRSARSGPGWHGTTGVLLFLAALAIPAARLFSRQADPARKQAGATNSARIHELEDGLLPAYFLRQPNGKTKRGAMKLADRMAHYKVPAVSIAVIDHGRIAWARAYGLADVRSGRRATPETLFQAASISKTLTAVTALRYVEAGKLSLDENVDRELKSWKVPSNGFTAERAVTLREILSHSAGLSVHGFAGYRRGQPIPTLEEVLDGKKPANSPPVRVILEPGTKWMYSGGGYTVLQQMLVDETGKPFPEILRENVLAPDGMTHSTYRQPLPKMRWADAATGYRATGREVRGEWHVYPEMAAAGLWTTPSDLSRFVISVEQAWEGKSSKLLSRKMARLLLSRQIDHWGLGFEIGGSGRGLWFAHSGGNEGFRCYEIGFPATGEGAVIMTNSDSGGQLWAEILRGIAVEYHWPEKQPQTRTVVSLSPKVLRQYAGRYRIEKGPVIAIEPRAGRLEATIKGELQMVLYPVSAADFVAPLGSGAEMTFLKDKQGRVRAVQIRTEFQTFAAKRLP